MVNTAKQIDGLVLRVVDTNVHVHKVVVQIADIRKGMLRDLLGDVCGCFHRAGLLQKLIPSQIWCTEALHLILNTDNCWFELARNVFQYLLTADGRVRNRTQSTPLRRGLVLHLDPGKARCGGEVATISKP
jgi:hypothetical protein